MGKRTTVVAVSALALLLACIALAVFRLYRPVEDKAPGAAKESAPWEVLSAIPSDAAAVIVFDGSSRAAAFLADSTGLLQAFLAPENPAFMGFLRSLGTRQAAVSLHNSGSLVPLIVAKAQPGDSLPEASAQKAGLKFRTAGPFVLASRSETFLSAGARQWEQGHSIVGTRGLRQLLAQARGPAFLLLSHAHAAKLLQVYASKDGRGKADIVKNLSPWSLWQIEALEKNKILLDGTALPGDGVDSFFACFSGTPRREPEFPETLPAATASAIAVPIEDTEAFLSARRKQEDGKGQLGRFNKALKAKYGRPLSVQEWFKSLQPREAVKAVFPDEKGVRREAVLVRSAREQKLGKEAVNAYPGALSVVLGPAFAVQDSVCASVGKWNIFGDAPAVHALSQKPESSLKELLSSASASLPKGMVAYASLSGNPEEAVRLLDSRLAQPLLSAFKGADFAPATAALDLSGAQPRMQVKVEGKSLKSMKAQELAPRDTVVAVPGGPFPVTNCGTGKTNYLYQNSHRSICLKDEKNKDLWGVPFKESLCGRVQTIDYYHNGKLQFLFCAGSKLYLMDRLGRWVNGFPVSLPKPVLLGPDAYDFTGAGGYTVMVLHKDNTLERYDLHGKKVSGWKGIRAPETVKNLPELLESGGKRYWVVRTAGQTLVYPFEGGEPVNPKKLNITIR